MRETFENVNIYMRMQILDVIRFLIIINNNDDNDDKNDDDDDDDDDDDRIRNNKDQKKNLLLIFNFSWDGCNTEEKWKTKVMQNLGDVQVAY